MTLPPPLLNNKPCCQQVDTVRAYSFGDRFLVEVHVVLDKDTPLRVAHDVGEKLEMMVETLQEVGRMHVSCLLDSHMVGIHGGGGG
jgi:divalent metal cation (Fe/Co/Zn/Cd) transporter